MMEMRIRAVGIKGKLAYASVNVTSDSVDLEVHERTKDIIENWAKALRSVMPEAGMCVEARMSGVWGYWRPIDTAGNVEWQNMERRE